jgi:hypothetical protein
VAFGVGVDENREWTWVSYALCLVIPGLLIGGLLVWMWLSFNRANNKNHKGEPYPEPGKKNCHLAAWLFVGYSSAVISTFPLLTLLLIFLKTDFLLEQDSYTAFGAGACGISLGILLAYGVSLAVLVQRSKGRAVQWVIVSTSTLYTTCVVMVFGYSVQIA